MRYSFFLLTVTFMFSACFSTEKKPIKTDLSKVTTTDYDLATVEKGGVANSIKLPAQLSAFQEVSIFPKVNGYVKAVNVDIGSRVSKGSLLMTLDAPELADAVMQAKERYVRSKVEFTIDKERYSRLLEASKIAGAISPLELSTAKAKMDADSTLCNAEMANWQMQQTMMGYLNVTAPFSGIITERNVHPGALVYATAKDKPMLELKQTERLRLQVDIPEALAVNLKNNDTVAFYVSAYQGKRLTGLINRASNNVNSQYRSERMEADVINKGNMLAPGMYADVVISSNGNTNALYVPKTAVVISTERKYVLVVNNGKIRKVDVTTGNTNIKMTEVYGDIKEGDKVIAKANDEIKEN